MSFRQKLAFGQKYQEIAKRYIPEDEKILEDALRKLRGDDIE